VGHNKHVPKLVETSNEVKVLWNQQVQRNGTFPSNRPDIIIHDCEKGTCMLIHVAISEGRNVSKKEANKIFKCNDLTIDIVHSFFHSVVCHKTGPLVSFQSEFSTE
jgi:hypothetical protein